MSVNTLCRRTPVTALPEESIREAAKRLERTGVGCLVVEGDSQRPIGMLTDRDIVTQVLALRRDPDSTQVRDVMQAEVMTTQESASLATTYHRMRSEGVRRVPVVDEAGRLCGILAIDDGLQLLAEELQGVAAVARAQFPSASPCDSP